jgi:hypothetical protein
VKLDGCKLLSESETEFRVSHPEHGEMRIAKEHLHHGTVQKIKQHFAEGGEVPSELGRGYDSVTDLPLGGFPMPPGAVDTEFSTGAPLPDAPSSPDASMSMAPAQGVPPGIARPDDAPPPPQAQMAPQTPLPGVSGEFNRGLQEELSGIKGQGEAAQTQAKAEAAAYDQRQQGLQKMGQEFDRQMAAHTARVQALQSDILNGKLDPNRLWNSRSTGQKITAALGMILGGAGSAVAGQPNYALEVIEKSIDRDIDSQKVELGKKESLLGMYMQQGHQLMTAHQMAKADYLDMTAAQLQKAAAQGAGDKAVAVAHQLAGAAHMQADQMRRNATLQGLQIQQQSMAVNFQRAQLGAMQGLLGGASSGGTNLDPRAEMLLPEEMRGRIVRLGDGSAALARTSKDAEEVKKTQESTAVLRDKLQRYNGLLEKHTHGVSSTFSNEDYNAAQALHDSILTDINGLAGLNRFTHEEAQIFSGRIPDITSKQIFRGHQAKLKELGEEIDSKVWNANRTYLSLPQKKRPRG